MIDEKQLINRLKEGDVQAMEPLMLLHQDYVYTLVMQIVKAKTIAEELTQDVFIKVFKKINTYQERARFTTWLYTIAYRTCLNYLEKKKIVFSLSDIASKDDENSESGFDTIIAQDQDFENHTHELNDTRQIVWKAIDKLPMQTGIIITLHYLQQFSVQEIADLLQTPGNTIKTHLHRGRAALKSLLLKEYNQEELT